MTLNLMLTSKAAVFLSGDFRLTPVNGGPHVVARDREIVYRRAERKRDARLGSDGLGQRLVQIGAMDHPVGPAVTSGHAGISRILER